MGATLSSQLHSRRSQNRDQERHEKESAMALLVFMEDEEQEEQELCCWKSVSKAIVDASEFPNHIISDASALSPGLPICAEAAPVYWLRQGEIYYAIPLHRLRTVFTAADMLSLLQRSRAAMADSPSLAFAEEEQQQRRQIFAIINHDPSDWDSEMCFWRTATKCNNKQQLPRPKVQDIGERVLKGPFRLSPVPECDYCEYE